MFLQKFSDADFSIDEKGIISGYVSVFNGVDSYGDTIVPEAYDFVLAEIAAGRMPMPKLFFNHDRWDIPLGNWLELKKDEKGIFGTTQLNTKLLKAHEVLEGVKFGSIDGFSVSIKVDDYNENAEHRVIKNILALPEISIVTYPADNAARITDIKSETGSCKRLKDIERVLRDVAPALSKTDVTAVVSAVRRIVKEEQSESASLDALTAIKNRIHQIAN